jgi:SAM-dependent methyltransferase
MSIIDFNYLTRSKIEKAMIAFAKNFRADQKVLDIGCGYRPYEKYFKCDYVGLDPYPNAKADIIANAWETPCENNEFDGIILNQALEHIEKTQKTVSEIERLLKPGGLCIITVPQTMKIHSIARPSNEVEINNFDKNQIEFFNVDYFRFTKFGLIVLFKNFKIVEIKQNTYYWGTIIQLINYFFASFGLGRLFAPIYFFNNLIAITIDKISLLITRIPLRIMKLIRLNIIHSLTIDNIFIVKKIKK